MKNIKLILPVIFFVLIFCLPFSFAQGIASRELIKNAKQYDGKIITYLGEVVGDVMVRGEFAWVNISDGDNALGVWVNAGQAKQIKFTGNYRSRGDSLEVVGTFHRACPEHGGDLDIHAQTLRKLASGRLIHWKLNTDKVNLVLILCGVLFLIWILNLFKRK